MLASFCQTSQTTRQLVLPMKPSNASLDAKQEINPLPENKIVALFKLNDTENIILV